MNPLSVVWLRIIRPSRKSGFVMPLVILMGLTLTLIGFAMIQRSSSQKADSTNKELTAKALSAAEAGITQVTNLMNTPANRFIATLPDCTDAIGNAGTTCSDASTVPNWKNLSTMGSWTVSIPAGTPACTAFTGTINQVNAIATSRNWKTLPQGEYRLARYEFQPDTANGGAIGLAPGTGILTVEGVINRGMVSEAKSRLEVKIPITRPPSTLSLPGFWVEQGVISGGSTTIAGNNTINADILVNDCNAPLASANFPSGSTYTAKYTTQTFPDLPPNPAGTSGCINLGNVTSDMELPRRNTSNNTYLDSPTTVTLNNGTTVAGYVYCVNNITLNGNEVMTIHTVDNRTTVNGTSNPNLGDRFMVVLHLQGNIDIGGTAAMNHRCVSPTPCTNYKATDLNIFGHDTPSPTPFILLSGTSSLDAFILAPEYNYGVNGGGSGTGVTGALMVKGVAGGSNTSNIIFNQITGVTWDDMMDGLQPGLTAPVLNATSSWKTQPTN